MSHEDSADLACCRTELMVPSDPLLRKAFLIDSFPKSATIISGDWELTGNRITGDPACSSNSRRVDRAVSSGTYKSAKEAIG